MQPPKIPAQAMMIRRRFDFMGHSSYVDRSNHSTGYR
jgi:hypothetical protein